jgi:hypothetical protein
LGNTREFTDDLYNIGMLNLALDNFETANDRLLEALELTLKFFPAEYNQVEDILEALSLADFEPEFRMPKFA